MTRHLKNDPAVTNFLKQKAFKTIPWQEERRLFVEARTGSIRARKRLIEVNTKFAAAVARNYVDRGLDLADLTSEAILGLSRAVDRFDHTTGNKFITYAVWWMRQGILTALSAQSRACKLPPNVLYGHGKVERARRRLEQRDARVPSIEEIAEEMEVGVDVVAGILEALAKPISLEYQPVEDSDAKFEDLLVDPSADAEAGARAGLDRRYVLKLVDRLEPRDAAIIRRCYGLDGHPEETLQAVADDIGLTRERVRQIKERAMERLVLYAKNLDLPPVQQQAELGRKKVPA